MNRFLSCCLLCFLFSFKASAQRDSISASDSIKQIRLAGVVIIGQRHIANKKIKVLSSLDGYLETHCAVNMIKRGAYAWEPLLNGMATERSMITIDGMRIYGACTDKMDPVTSYVEVTNLSKANIHSGQSGAVNGATIAGSIDLVRRQSGFENGGFRGSVFTGLETANMQKIAGLALQRSCDVFFTDVDFTYRDADNYKAGGGKEILYSQFTKYNVSAIAGWKINDHGQVTGSLIYDRAVDTGYPALPMDVSLAKAFIGSVQYECRLSSPLAHIWQTKLYYNNVTHIMDDTKRPMVSIRMDMPGWAKTAGFYSKLNGEAGKHLFMVNLSGHYNKSLAEMTMYANNPNEKNMFMLTWPGVHTFYGGLFIEDKLAINKNWNAVLSLGTGFNHNNVKSDFGYGSLQIFYPQMQRDKERWLKSMTLKMNYVRQKWQHNFGLGYGERAPSVSEGYGFYLFNSFDRFDYIGNPNLSNEKSVELNASSWFADAELFIQVRADFFKLFNYILGKQNLVFSPMTIGANGIKVYQQLPRANIFNISLSADYRLNKALQWFGRAIYRKGWAGGLNLPQIQPLSYGATLQYRYKKVIAETGLEGALAQTKYSPDFGESFANAYNIFNLSASWQFNFSEQKLAFKAGIENLFDSYYSTFADWNKIPRMGRNIFVNVVYGF